MLVCRRSRVLFAGLKKCLAPSETTATKVSQGRQRRPDTIFRSYGAGKGAKNVLVFLGSFLLRVF